MYLTSCYAGSFADIASNQFTHAWAIVEVDVEQIDLARLVPDERWVAQTAPSSSGGGHPPPGEALPRGGPVWQRSLSQLGLCAHRGAIPLGAISRVSLYEPYDHPIPAEWVVAEDTRINLASHERESQMGRLFTRWCFEPISEHDLAYSVRLWLEGTPESPAKERRVAAELAYRKVVLEDRTGLTIFENPAYRRTG